MTLDLESIKKGSEAMDRIADRLSGHSCNEITICLDEFIAVIEGYKATAAGLRTALSMIAHASEKAYKRMEEERDVLTFIDEHRDGFQSLMRRCGI